MRSKESKRPFKNITAIIQILSFIHSTIRMMKEVICCEEDIVSTDLFFMTVILETYHYYCQLSPKVYLLLTLKKSLHLTFV